MSNYSMVQSDQALKEFDSKWKVVGFEELLEDVSSGNKKLKKSDYQEIGELPVVDQGKDLIAGYTKKEDAVEASPPYIVFGDHTRIFKEVDFKMALGADGVKLLKIKDEFEGECYYKFLFYFFQTLNIPDTGYNRHFKYLKNVKIPLPSLSEQKAIVAKLDRAQRLIDIDREMLAKYDELIQSVFLEMFGDPVRNEKGWEVKKLGNVGTLARGKSKHRPRNDPSILGGEYPLIQTGDVANAGLFITEYSSTYNEAGLKQSKLWDNGTLCITIAANIAKVGILDFDACFPDSVVGFKSEKASSIFIYAWMGFLQNIIEEQAPVSAQKNINLRILNDLDIIFPPLSLQREYEQIVLKVDRERKEIENLNQKSEELFSSLVQEAFG